MMNNNIRRGVAGALVLIALSLAAVSRANITVSPLLPPLPPKAEADPAVLADINSKGYHVSEISGGYYWITNGDYHSMAVVTNNGVVLVDAPEPLPFFPPMDVLGAVAEITPKPITHLIYSHAHSDHIAGAGLVKQAYPNLKIIAHKETERLLKRIQDPKRPVPTRTFKKHKRLNIGGKRLKLSYFGNTHMDGNIFVYAPDEKILMLVDVIFPGWVPFRRLALSDDISGWTAAHDVVLSYDFDTLIGGHVTRLGDVNDVLLQKEYVNDIVTSVDSVMLDANTIFTAVGAIDAVHGAGSSFQESAKWSLFSAFYDASTSHCANILDAKYIEGQNPGDNPLALGGAEAFNFSNCEAYFVAHRLGVLY